MPTLTVTETGEPTVVVEAGDSFTITEVDTAVTVVDGDTEAVTLIETQPIVVFEQVDEIVTLTEQQEIVLTDSGAGLQGNPGPVGDTGPAGPQGPAGPSGSAAASYVHTQNSVASTWVITHNLGFYPNVRVIDSGGSTVEGEIVYTSTNALSLNFTSGFTGLATLS